MPARRALGIACGLAAAFAHPAAFADTAAAPGIAAGHCPDQTAIALEVRGAFLCASFDDERLSLEPQRLAAWIERSAQIVADYYARFPAPLVLLRIRAVPGGGVRGGRTTRGQSALVIEIRVGRDVTPGELAADWVLVHEMVHLALPDVGRSHDWLAEGLATYVEGIARAQFGSRDIADVWAEFRRSMPSGLPRAGEGGMDQTPTWGRTYWGGALYCLQSEVSIRETTGNRAGLRTALRAIVRETGGYRSERSIGQVLRIGDAATGTHVLEDLYQRTRATPVTPDLDLLWSRLGVPANPRSEPFDDHAPLAAIRTAITARPQDPP